MEFHSPDRPRSPLGHPQYAEGQSPLPGIYVTPLHEPGMCELEAFLLLPGMRASSFHSEPQQIANLPELFSAYALDPEAFLLRIFNYTPPAKAQQGAKPKSAGPSLEDLGLA